MAIFQAIDYQEFNYYNQYYWNYWNQVHDYHSESPSDERWLPYGHHQPNKAEYEYDPSQYNHDEYLNDPYLVNNNRFSETTYPAVEEEPDEVDDDNEGEEEPTFTLNEVFLEYLIQSEKRRQERKLKERQMEKEEEEKMILGVKIDESAEDATDIRKARLNEKYGDSAMEIEQLETQLQLSFNTYSDKNHPILWPVLPLNLRYTSEEVQ
ncbi:uncharacterized protein TRIADDRAFT_60978 [Trichoplax adhaerens]|uniref:Gem-associated protein 8 n=1 Tax=Trichoplax adhaerens TaxID=10228 RepID=B3S9P3_TRIAD|nr:hypothetical protein TRIADDRAFT_60978 [Trichoplax adhaerens]EDV20509.1 hypothetical protein TRIADDRAFT_60978 [Trichoplax adhaerens]|eukprot:XP_002116935.1 hypothetical protein TRIADDRAFT_60978 [Trichoplax adhaerens]